MWARAFGLAMLMVAAVSGCASQGSFAMSPKVMSDAWPSTNSASHAGLTDKELAQAYDRAMAMVSDLNYAEAAGQFKTLTAGFAAAGDSERAAESAFWHGFCLEKLGQLPGAAGAYRRVIRDYPQTKAARQANSRLAGLGRR